MLVKQPSQVYKGDVGDNCWSPGEGLGSSALVGVAWLAEWTARGGRGSQVGEWGVWWDGWGSEWGLSCGKEDQELSGLAGWGGGDLGHP